MMTSKLKLFLAMFAAATVVSASLAAQTSFAGTGVGAIPDGGTYPGPGTPLDVQFAVTGMNGPLTDMSVDFNVGHTWVGDLRVTLTSPGGLASRTIMSGINNTGTTNSESSDVVTANNLAFNNAATGDIWAVAAGLGSAAAIPAGAYRTTDHDAAGAFTDLLAPFSALTSAEINGTWTLRFEDMESIITGSVTAANLVLTGTSTPTAPTITSTAPATASVGTMYTYTVTATGNPAVTFSIAPDPSIIGSGWLTWDGTDTLSGTPLAGDVGNFPTLTITATNGVAPDATEVINIVVSQPAPEIDVTDPGTDPVTNGQTYTVYGLYATGPNISGIFTLTNSGTATLNVTAFNTTNTNCTVTVTPASALPWALASGGGFDTFMVDLAPGAAGAFSGSVSIVSDDADENPFVINFNGNCQATNEPEIAIHRLPADTDVANNSTINETNTGLASFNRTFSIRNEGSAMLTLTGAPVVVSAPVNVIVTITQPPFTTIAGASGDANSEDFILGIAPIAAGAFSFTVTIANDDADENPFVFNYTGHTSTPSSSGGGGGDGDDDGCSTSSGNSSWLVLFAALAGLGFALRLRKSRA